MEVVQAGLLRQVAERTGHKLPFSSTRGRIALLIGATFLVPALLALLGGRLGGPGWTFGHDVAVTVRFLWVLPLLIALEPAVNREVHLAVVDWAHNGLVPPERRPAFLRTTGHLQRLARSSLVGVATLVAAGALSYLETRTKLAHSGAHNWMFHPDGAGRLNAAGWWYALVSVPLLYAQLLRWLWRFGLWAALLARLALLPPRLLGLHPDRIGGLDRVQRVHNLFAGLLLGLASLAAAGLANQLLHGGLTVAGARMPAITFLVIALIVFLGPLAFFSPALLMARRRASALYGDVSDRHSADFEALSCRIATTNPVSGGRIPDAILENQSNLATSFDVLRAMHMSLVNLENLKLFGLAAATPLALAFLARLPLADVVKMLQVLL